MKKSCSLQVMPLRLQFSNQERSWPDRVLRSSQMADTSKFLAKSPPVMTPVRAEGSKLAGPTWAQIPLQRPQAPQLPRPPFLMRAQIPVKVVTLSYGPMAIPISQESLTLQAAPVTGDSSNLQVRPSISRVSGIASSFRREGIFSLIRKKLLSIATGRTKS